MMKMNDNATVTRRSFLKTSISAAGMTALAATGPGRLVASNRTTELDEYEQILESVDAALPDGLGPTREQTDWAFSELSRTRDLIKQAALEMGIDVDNQIEIGGEWMPEYDWQPRSYAELVALEEEIYGALSGQPENAQLDWRRLFAKVLAALGIRDAWNAFKEVLEELGETLLEAIGRAITDRDWRKLRKLLRLLLDLVTSARFRQRLEQKVGETVAARIIGRILAKALPIIGWALLILEFVWAIAEQVLNIIRTNVPAYAEVERS